MKVKFKHYHDCYYIKPFSYPKQIQKERQMLQIRARNLARIERYSRKAALLSKDEYLEYVRIPVKNIRIPYIKQIALDMKLCSIKDNFKIVK